jgi:hypothetical protein
MAVQTQTHKLIAKGSPISQSPAWVLCASAYEGARYGYRFTGQGSYAELLPPKLFNSNGDPGETRTLVA